MPESKDSINRPLTQYKCKRIDDDAARSTINSELSALSRAFKLALRARKVQQIPPIDRFGQLNNARTGFFGEKAFQEVCAKLLPHWRPPIEFSYYTGWRVRSEVLTLTWAQVELKAKIVRLETGTTKNREGRVFPFATYPQVEELLTRQRLATRALEKDRGSIIPWVFHRDGRRLADYKRAGKTACEGAGHQTEAVYRRYAITNEQDLAEGIAKLARLHGEAPGRSTLGAHSVGGAG